MNEGATEQPPPGHLYAPTSAASDLLKVNAAGHEAMHARSSGSMGFGIYLPGNTLISCRWGCLLEDYQITHITQNVSIES